MALVDTGTGTAARPPLWRRIWDFPLVAMLVSLALVLGTIIGTGKALSGLPALLGKNAAIAIQASVSVGLVFLICKLAIRYLGERRHDDLPLASALKQVGLGITGGAALMALVVALAALVGVYRIIGPGGGEDAVIILFGGGLVAAFVEEVLFRGILFRWIEEFAGSWAALAITSALFGLAHLGNDNATVFSSVAIAIEAGIMLGAAYMLTRSLWLAIGIHFGWNVAQGLVFDVPVSGHPVRGLVEAQLSGPELLSGGAFGLEASVIALLVASLAGLWLTLRAIKAGHIMPPRWVRRRLERDRTAGVFD